MSKNNKDNSLKYSLIGASLLAGVGAVGYFLYNRSSSSTQKYGNVKNLSKATTVKVLKQLKKELFTSFSTMSMMAQQIKAQTRGRASEAEVKEFVVMHPQINEEFKASEARAYKKHNITQKEFEHAVEVLFKNDEEVQKHRQEIKANFDKAASGSQLDIKTEIPQSLTSQNTLQIIEEIMKASCKKIQEVFQQLSEDGGQVNMNDPQTLKALNSMKIDDIKAGILEKHGLENYDDPGTKILQYATTKYQQENPDGFSEKMMQLEMKHRRSMELIQQNPADKDIIEKTFNEAAKPMGGAGGMFGMKIGNRTKKEENIEKIVRNEEKTEEEGEQKKTEEGEQQAEKKTEEEGEKLAEGEQKEEGEQKKEEEGEKKEEEVEQQQQQNEQDKQVEESVEIIKKSEEEQQQPEQQQPVQQETEQEAQQEQGQEQEQQAEQQEQQQEQEQQDEQQVEQTQEAEKLPELSEAQQLQKQAEQTQEQNEEQQINQEQKQEEQ